ncbi:hypothetical protein EV567_2580 [Streptomyces sp. BK239]|nr:hypothetical protein EV567_2580 [Streptomyces sp. BK239]
MVCHHGCGSGCSRDHPGLPTETMMISSELVSRRPSVDGGGSPRAMRDGLTSSLSGRSWVARNLGESVLRPDSSTADIRRRSPPSVAVSGIGVRSARHPLGPLDGALVVAVVVPISIGQGTPAPKAGGRGRLLTPAHHCPQLPSRPPSTHTPWSGRGSGRQGGARHCTNDLDAPGPRLLGSAWVDGGRDGSSPCTPLRARSRRRRPLHPDAGRSPAGGIILCPRMTSSPCPLARSAPPGGAAAGEDRRSRPGGSSRPPVTPCAPRSLTP